MTETIAQLDACDVDEREYLRWCDLQLARAERNFLQLLRARKVSDQTLEQYLSPVRRACEQRRMQFRRDTTEAA